MESVETRREYRLERRIAVGGMAEVFLARLEGPSGFRRKVVVKKIHPRWANNEDVLSLFRDEARLGASLRHHNIVQVLDYGRSGEGTYLVLEFVDGRNLAELITAVANQRDYVPSTAAAFAVAECCAALEHIHSRTDVHGSPLGVVHRDINPANVLLSWDGEVKITDFGVAAGHHRELKTAHGILRGTFPYMSPEQTLCQPVDGRSDIFSLGVVLYECLTAHHPFADEDDYLTIKAIQDEVPASPDRLRADLDPAICAIVRRAMAKDPEDRYPTARAFQDDLLAWLRSQRASHGGSGLARLMESAFPDPNPTGGDVDPVRIRLGPTTPGSGKPLLDLSRLEARRGPQRIGGAISPDESYRDAVTAREPAPKPVLPELPAPWDGRRDQREPGLSASLPPAAPRGPVSMQRIRRAPARRPEPHAWVGWCLLLAGAVGVLAWALYHLG